jgi:hypothetical protein
VRSSEKCFSGPTFVIYLQAARSSKRRVLTQSV